ncbi:hypothetical protein, partial [Aneurinibacillus aneurinilyticus]
GQEYASPNPESFILQEMTVFLCAFLTFNKNGASSSQLSLTFWTAPLWWGVNGVTYHIPQV